MSNVLATLFSDIANAIRGKTGNTDKMSPKDFPSQIDSITGGSGGGIPEGYKTVTFMNGDKVYYERLVLSGDDCPDPLIQGRIETPTKESTVQYSYTYSGWSDTEGGTVDSSILNNITEDKVIYATYTETVLKYTITYYDDDGTTVLHTAQVDYGALPSYTGEKDGYNFVEWQPKPTAVTGDASYTAVWNEKLTFSGGSWRDIIAIVEAGQAEEHFAVGDTKTITASDGTVLNLYILGFNHDDLADGTGKASMTILSQQCLPDTMALDDWETVATNMKTVLKPKLPEALQSAIKPVTKLCSNFDSNSISVAPTISSVTFELFPLSVSELKIQSHVNRNVNDSDWYTFIPNLGPAYALSVEKYIATYGGPGYSAPFNRNWDENCWMRQSLAGYKSQGIYLEMGYTGSKHKHFTIESKTTSRKIQLAFCI